MKRFLIFFLLLFAHLAAAEISVSGSDMIYNATLVQFDVQTPPQAISSIFVYNDNGNSNATLEAVQIPTLPEALSRIFHYNEASINAWALESGNIPTEKKPLKSIFVIHEFARNQNNLVYPKDLLNDNVPPVIKDIAVDEIKPNEARINWTTNEYATSLVEYRSSLDSNEGSKKDALFTMNHSILLEGLLPGTLYYFAVNSTDRSGNSAESAVHEFETSWT